MTAGKTLPRVTLLTTGGTIAGAPASRAPGGYDAGKIAGADLLAAAPGITQIAELTVEQIANIGSQDMHDAIWFKLARRIDAIFAKDATDGIVITHGTDTLEETAFFLELTLATRRPVVLTGAMLPPHVASADGPANLLHAVQVAAYPNAQGHGVMAVMNETIFAPRYVVKTHTSAINAFASINAGPLGCVNASGVQFHQQPLHGSQSAGARFCLPDSPPLPAVAIIYAHAGMDSGLIEAALNGGAQGIVLAGVGNGNAANAAQDALTTAARRGILVVRATRMPGGCVNRNVETDDDKRGFVVALDLPPAKARILAQLLLANDIRDPRQVQTEFARC
ncbi:MAG: asparaginase [Kiritimatiellia bacterium]|jgi:L-asparaginase